MTHRVVLVAEAEEQLRRTIEWWQANRASAPTLLLDEFEQVACLLEEMPGIGPRFQRATVPGIRRILMQDPISGCITPLIRRMRSFTFWPSGAPFEDRTRRWLTGDNVSRSLPSFSVTDSWGNCVMNRTALSLHRYKAAETASH